MGILISFDSRLFVRKIVTFILLVQSIIILTVRIFLVPGQRSAIETSWRSGQVGQGISQN
jgi:hypothetical protein